MIVDSINDGPVTMVYDDLLEEPPKNKKVEKKVE